MVSLNIGTGEGANFLSIQKMNLEFYTYETPCISIYWNGKRQPYGLFKSALEALEQVERVRSSTGASDNWQLNIPAVGLVSI
jgi:hypothetical protein